MDEEIRETEGTAHGATVFDVLEATGATIVDVADITIATGMSFDEMRSTTFGSIDAEQLRDVAVTLRRSSDELLAIAEEPEAELARRKAIVRARLGLEDAASILADRANGAACLMRQMGEGDGIGTERAAALDLLADVLDDAANGVRKAYDALNACVHC